MKLVIDGKCYINNLYSSYIIKVTKLSRMTRTGHVACTALSLIRILKSNLI
jgi:hypothetical protein